MTKKNTFTDFIDVAAALTTSGWTSPGAIAGMGASAGGLLMGVVLNTAPEGLFKAVVSQVRGGVRSRVRSCSSELHIRGCGGAVRCDYEA